MASAAFASAVAAPLPSSTSSSPGSERPPLRLRHPDMGEAADSSDEEKGGVSEDEGETTAVDDGTYASDNYVRKVLAKERPLPPITLADLHKNINVISTLAVVVPPALAIYGALTTELKWQTALWSFIYYFYTGLGARRPLLPCLLPSTHLFLFFAFPFLLFRHYRWVRSRCSSPLLLLPFSPHLRAFVLLSPSRILLVLVELC